MAKWMPSSSTARDRQIAWRVRRRRSEPPRHIRRGASRPAKVDADMGAVMEGDAFGLHLLGPADRLDTLLHLEVLNAVAKQATGLGEISRRHARRGLRARAAGAGDAGRAYRAYHSDFPAGLVLRGARCSIHSPLIALSAIAHSTAGPAWSCCACRWSASRTQRVQRSGLRRCCRRSWCRRCNRPHHHVDAPARAASWISRLGHRSTAAANRSSFHPRQTAACRRCRRFPSRASPWP